MQVIAATGIIIAVEYTHRPPNDGPGFTTTTLSAGRSTRPGFSRAGALDHRSATDSAAGECADGLAAVGKL